MGVTRDNTKGRLEKKPFLAVNYVNIMITLRPNFIKLSNSTKIYLCNLYCRDRQYLYHGLSIDKPCILWVSARYNTESRLVDMPMFGCQLLQHHDRPEAEFDKIKYIYIFVATKNHFLSTNSENHQSSSPRAKLDLVIFIFCAQKILFFWFDKPYIAIYLRHFIS